MYTLIRSVLCLFLFNTILAKYSLDKYYEKRENLIHDEFIRSLGANLTLTDDEKTANSILMREKDKEIDAGFKDPVNYNMSKPYYEYRENINDSKVYQIIRRMPKGAVLHVHVPAMMGPEYVTSLTYDDNLYTCQVFGKFKLQFSTDVPELPCPTKWQHLNSLRKNSGDPELFDEELKQQFMLKINKGDDIDAVWKKFENIFKSIKQLLVYRPIREKFFYDALKKFYDDNILYIEIRSGLDELYELDGTVHDKTDLVRLYYNVTKKFMKKFPDFLGVKMILSKGRRTNINEVRKILQTAMQLKEEMPDFIIGFDLVAQEDLGKPLVEFLPVLAEYKDKINFFFHAGETNWFGTSSDENLVDAILLGAKRIGHGHALIKHPALMDAVKRREIAIEVNLISNNVLSLVSDVRNHPLAYYLSVDLPVVLSSDDPGIWESDPLSDDFYVAFTGVASRRSDIRILKQLAINSIRYSAMDNSMKYKAIRIFSRKWNKFIDDLNQDESENCDD